MLDELLHVLARALLRISSPLKTYELLCEVGSVLPQRKSYAAVRSAFLGLSRRGTCLSRAMAIAARAPNVEIVIGLLPRSGVESMLAHAWLEFEGVPVDCAEARGVELARIPTGRTSRRVACGDAKRG
jgi:hypothetical protein